MRFLLDTHVFLWVVSDSERLNADARRLLAGADAIFVSSASIWEIAIKSGLGKLDADPERMLSAIAETGFEELPVLGRHAAAVAQLPLLHRDPFDRLLVAQAITEPMRLLSGNPQLKPYSELVIPV